MAITYAERIEVLNSEALQAEYMAAVKAHVKVVRRSRENMRQYVIEKMEKEKIEQWEHFTN